MSQRIFSLLFFLLLIHFSFSQTATVKGIVKDGSNKDAPLELANVVQPPANGTFTDSLGRYELKVQPGDVTIIFSYTGMKADTQQLKLKPGEVKTLDIILGTEGNELQQVVVGETKIGIKIQKVTQTVTVMGQRVLESNNITNIQSAMNKIPGVTILDGQMSIRGGSGYAYGSGSRVLLVVDEMPLMSADRGGIVWPLMPVENLEQVELVKGASTVQYGSSALNGVINVTTGYAKDTPITKFSFFYEAIGKPPVDSFQWWKRNGRFFENPNTIGFSFMHSQKFHDVDFVFSGLMQGSQSYLQQEYDYFTRFTQKLRWQPHRLKRLTLEIMSNLLYRRSGSSFYWQDGGHPYITASGVNLNERYFYAFIDPKIRFLDKRNNQYKLLTRISRQNNVDGDTDFWVFRTDFQFRHDFGNIVRLLMGINNEHSIIKDGTLGTHQQDFGGGFAQLEVNYKWLSANVGAREEYYRLDSAISPTVPVFRAGVNFEIRKYNYIRLSFGQSFRVPSIAERFVQYNLAGIRILPNYGIKPERGFTAEIGYKRSLKFGKWLGYFDAAAFVTEFRDMIEFTFGTKYTPQDGLYPFFQSQNVSRARVFGWEFNLFGEGKMGPVDMSALVGYTYFYGVDLNDTTVTHNVGDFLGDAFKKYRLPTPVDVNGDPSYAAWDSLTQGMLKYRNRHTFKADLDFIFYNRVRFGTSIQYYSFMDRVDKIFEVFIKDIRSLREQRLNKGDVIWDLRAGYIFNPNIQLNFLVKNVLNANYALRVAKPDRPRSFTVQMVLNFGGMNKQQSKARQSSPAGSL
ncbi:MAG: TonB-dependent receptor [Chitinophagales bacterium]